MNKQYSQALISSCHWKKKYYTVNLKQKSTNRREIRGEGEREKGGKREKELNAVHIGEVMQWKI